MRNPDHVSEVEEAGATALVADVEQMSTEEIAERLRGFDAVVWSAGAGGGSPARTYAVDRDGAIRSMSAAETAGVKRYVMVSYFGAGPHHGVPPDNPFFRTPTPRPPQTLTSLDRLGLDRPRPEQSHRRAGHRQDRDRGVSAASVSRDDVAAVAARPRPPGQHRSHHRLQQRCHSHRGRPGLTTD